MENSKIITNWLKDTAQGNNFKITKETWIKDFFPQLFCYKAEYVYKNERILGLGISFDEHEAFLKSFSEVVERSYVSIANISSSSGCAVHFTPKQAIECARTELFERDAFLFHFLNHISFRDNQARFFDFKERCILRSLVKLGFKYRIKRSETCIGEPLSIFYLFPPNYKGFILGLGAGKQALIRSILEVLHDGLKLYIHKNIRDISLNQFSEIKNPTFRNHMQLALNADYCFKYFSSFTKEFEAMDTSLKPTLDYNIEPMAIHKPFQGLPLYFARVSSKDLQHLFRGGKNSENYNPSRIGTVTLNRLVHPVS